MTSNSHQAWTAIDALILLRESDLFDQVRNGVETKHIVEFLTLVGNLLNGDHASLLRSLDGSDISLHSLLQACRSSNVFDRIRNIIQSHIMKDSDNEQRIYRTMQCLLLGVTFLELFCQANYTGPELTPTAMEIFEIDEQCFSNCIQELECDGVYAYRMVSMPQMLLIARCILMTLANPLAAGWKRGIKLDKEGSIHPTTLTPNETTTTLDTLISNLMPSRHWWSARAAVLHARLLQSQEYEKVPTLWQETGELFHRVLQEFCAINPTSSIKSLNTELTNITVASTPDAPTVSSDLLPPPPAAAAAAAAAASEIPPRCRSLVACTTTSSSNAYVPITDGRRLQAQLSSQAWLEWGLCCGYFSFGDKGKRAFQRAREAASLHVEMRSALGKRTKHQHTAYAQLYLYARSTLVAAAAAAAAAVADHNNNNNNNNNSAIKKDDGPQLYDAAEAQTVIVAATSGTTPTAATKKGGDEDVTREKEGWQHSEWELGRRLVKEGAGGEEVAVREVMLDSMDGGAVENVILEGGPTFTSSASVATAEDVALDRGGSLHPIDQSIILALCLDVSNSNPVDGLTNEEMQPFVERVLDIATNWMIHSTALLERSWLEFERRKTMDRAMLQIQALIDQHTTKLTMMQSTYQSVEDSAPVQDRLRYLYAIAYPAQYELKRDLAVRYLRCQVFVSALNYFRELELWDEVVTCYQLLDKPHRAEMVVREQLQEAGETPYMLTSLADLTGKLDLYTQAWELSKGRYPRAKRTLGKICYDKGDFAACKEHMDDALAVQPLIATAWYLKGLACMRLELWDEAVQSFVRCVQQDMEIGEAWANIGAVYMRLRAWPKAYGALEEALRHKRDSWKITENIMSVALAMGRWRDVVRHMHTLLELRLKSQRPVHIDETRHLAYIVSSQAQRAQRAQQKLTQNAAETGVGEGGVEVGVSRSSDSTNLNSNTNATHDPAPVDDDLPVPPPPTHSTEPTAPEVEQQSLVALRPLLVPDLDAEGSLLTGEDEAEAVEDLASDIAEIVEVQPLPDLVKAVEQLLVKITNSIPSDPEIWDIFAEFSHTLGRFANAHQCRLKQFRAQLNEASWEKDSQKTAALVTSAIQLVRSTHYQSVQKKDIYSTRMLIQTLQRKISNIDSYDCTSALSVMGVIVAKLSIVHDAMK